VAELEDRTRYDPSEVEPRIARRWLDSGLFGPEPAGTAAENYSIAIPPPNVTGSLHMGHAFQDTIMDALIRRHRMTGQRTKWILGTDHAGIATQTQVEQLLAREGTGREELGREAFEERVWRWREQYGGAIIEQLKRLGASCDYGDERFTLDDEYAQAVLRVFVALYEKGYIYRDRYLVNWDPGTASAISDLEVEEQEVTDTLYFIDYQLVDEPGSVTVATVRPETMLADTAVAVHPDDERYAHLIGGRAILPLVGRELPIIADDYVKPEFGTGALKITPGHDPNDFEIGRRHGLEQISVIGEDGRLTDQAPAPFAGLTTAEAQRAVVTALDEQGLISKREDYLHSVPFSQRSGERIEPLISLQWFMRMDELARPAIDVVRSGQVTFHPARWTRVYMDWMENIRPWCISRQLWWGHRIPVWYRGEETHVGLSAPEGEGWERDPDVLDTWFSSALWPFATLGWPEQTPALRAFYPTDVLVTARDIIFLWVARMIMMGLEFAGGIPFSDVHIHSIIQAPDGRRMSKSLGTGIDPLDLMNGGPRPPVFEQLDDAGAARSSEAGRRAGGKPAGEFPAYGADALRWGLLAMSSSQDVRFAEDKIAQGSQLANKLWNAARLILLGIAPETTAAVSPRTVEDRWILSRLERAKTEVTQRIDAYDFSHAALALYDFVYAELCDWYLELVKPRLREHESELSATLLEVLVQTLALAHPIIPFITEEIYSYVPGADGLLAAGVEGTAAPVDEAAEASLDRVIEAIQALRAWRDFAEVKAAAMLPARLLADGYDDTAEHLSRLARLSLQTDGGDPVAAVPVPGGAVELLASPDLDLRAAERKRAARRAKLDAEIAALERKLANPGFVEKAPAEVVEKARADLERLRAEWDAL
jgi:valyl-tRNA synthetase